MKLTTMRPETRAYEVNGLAARVARKLVGQQAAIDAIVPFVQMQQAGLCPEGRPVGIFMLLGPTGTGKTRTVEAFAEALHGSAKKILKVDCGEFQLEHEVAKLVGSPPGYLGHRETTPMLTQQKLQAISSDLSDISVVLFDEIEKAAGSMSRILLGILDKATLRLGDNTTVNFERALIFLTSNLGSRSISQALNPSFGYQAYVPRERRESSSKLQKIGMNAVRRKFSPEFVNRLDAVVTFQPLSPDALVQILEQQISELQQHIINRLGQAAFAIELTPRAKRFLLKLGTSEEFGARELKRTLQRYLIQPLALQVVGGEIEPHSVVRADLNDARTKLVMRTVQDDRLDPAC